jgi:DinB family protein
MNAAISSAALHPELDDYVQQISRIRDDAKKLTSNLSEAQLNWRTHPGRWSIAQCLQHLTLGNEAYLPQIDTGITQARERKLLSSGPYKHGWFGNWFARSFEPPPKFKMKNPKAITPPPDLDGAQVIARFDRSWVEILRRVYDAHGLDLGRTRVISPFISLIRLDVGQAFGMLTSHARRHVWQAWQVRNDANFPTS